MRFVLSLCAASALFLNSHAVAAPTWIEAESFDDPGGWVLDTQFIETMGSAYLMAHGMGKPVRDATTSAQVPAAGKFRMWVRDKNWVGPWNAPGAPGRFQLLVNGHPLGKDFGVAGTDWQWEDGGEIELPAGPVKIALHDLTGFDGRCDCLFLTDDLGFTPPSESRALAAFRHQQLHLPDNPPETKIYDVVVVGGGYAGVAAALSAARQGLSVALVQDRAVLGGNGSSEVQVWAQGGTRRGLYPHLGEIVEEFADRASNSPGRVEEYGDALKEKVVRQEKNLDLFLNHHVWKVQMASGTASIINDKTGEPMGYGLHISAVTALNVKTGQERKFRGKYFVDCTGHGSVGALARASFTMLEKKHLGMSNMWVIAKKSDAQPWPATPWALDLQPTDFPAPHPMKSPSKSGNPQKMAGDKLPELHPFKPDDFLRGEWFWESGFNLDPLTGLELMRDWNFRAVYGAFTALRKQDPQKYGNYAFDWLAYIGGTRESRLLQGDVVLTQEDVVSKKVFPDGCVPTTWDLDLHYPKEQYMKRYPDNPFISRAAFGKGVDKGNGYPVPYRCFYSKDVNNLFMAGRCISVSHDALGTVRVMRTCGMMGEVVGKAAYLCVRHETTPRGVYDQYLDDLKDLMRQRGAMRRDGIESALYLPPNAAKLPPLAEDAAVAAPLEGIVIDDAEAELTGKWSTGKNLKPYIGQGYRYASANSKAGARFVFSVKETGEYEVRINWQPFPNRATSAPVTVLSADGPQKQTVDQTKAAELPNGFHSLGKFKFNAGEEAAVSFSTEGSKGTVHIDAVQVLPVK